MLIREDILGDNRGRYGDGQRTSCEEAWMKGRLVRNKRKSGDSQELAESGC